MNKRVVVTGLGALTPIGNTTDSYWDALVKGVSGADTITYFDTTNFKTKFACELKGFDSLNFFSKKDIRKIDKFTQYAIVSTDEAIADANIENYNHNRIGVIWGAGIGGIETFQNEIINFSNSPNKIPRFSPFFIPKIIPDIVPGIISIKHKFRGPNFTTVSACASSANAIIDACNYIKLGYADIIVSGGSEAAVVEAGIGGFNALHALSIQNDSPEKASKPFDKERDGFVLGEGSGALILESLESAQKRDAKIYAEIIGCGLSADAHHMTAPHPDGVGVKIVMDNCIENAGILPYDVTTINTHGTSTPLGDVAELKAIKEVFGDHIKNISINSTKSMTGHLLGAAGSIESIASILSIKNNVIPPTINHSTIDEEIDTNFDLTLNKSKKRDVKIAMSNTFGFGGHNACILFKEFSE